MNWLFWALLAAAFNGIADILFKLVNGKIHNGLSGVIINIFSVIPVLIYTIYSKLQGQPIPSSKEGIAYSILAGLIIGCITLSMFKMFNQTGSNLSLAIPIMRISVVLSAVFFGILIFHDSINIKFIIGLIISLIGLFLVVTANN
jgi:uncharacterized membrane protein